MKENQMIEFMHELTKYLGWIGTLTILSATASMILSIRELKRIKKELKKIQEGGTDDVAD